MLRIPPPHFRSDGWIPILPKTFEIAGDLQGPSRRGQEVDKNRNLPFSYRGGFLHTKHLLELDRKNRHYPFRRGLVEQTDVLIPEGTSI